MWQADYVYGLSELKKHMSYDIFISYSRKDSAIVKRYYDYLKAAGLSVWVDETGIETGTEFKKIIVRAIKDSKVFLFFSSAASNASPWTVKEVNVAVSYRKRIIPVKLDTTPYDESIMFDLAGLDFYSHADKGFEVGIKKLLSAFGKDYDKVVKLVPKESGKQDIEPISFGQRTYTRNRSLGDSLIQRNQEEPNTKIKEILKKVNIAILTFGIGFIFVVNFIVTCDGWRGSQDEAPVESDSSYIDSLDVYEYNDSTYVDEVVWDTIVAE